MKVPVGDRKRARIEMIPLIDVTFLLLVFFIYISLSMTIHRGIPLNLPHASTVESARAKVIEVSVDPEGEVFVDGVNVPLESLSVLLKQKARVEQKDTVSLQGDRAAVYDRITRVLDHIRLAGIEKVSLEATPKEE